MQKDNSEKPKRKVIRLPDYDYSRNGLYYLTLCTQQKKHLFGFINDEKMNLNQAGKMMEYWFFEIEKHFETTKCIANQIMPNHIHCILEIDNQKPGRTHRSAPTKADEVSPEGKTSRSMNCLTTHRSAPTLSQIVQWFKTMTTNEYIKNVTNNNWPRFDKKLWQRSYYDHIIRDEEEFEHAILYIQRNPERWVKDEYNM